MSLDTYPVTPVPSFDVLYGEEFKTLVSTFLGANEQRQSTMLFPKRTRALPYDVLDISTEWYLIHDFYRKNRGGWVPFWFFDFDSRAIAKEYVGRGGPFVIDGAIADDGGVQTDETLAARNTTVNDMTLLPVVPAGNDAYYFGGNIMFDKITLTIGTQGVGVWTIVWEYWNGSAWATLAGIADGTTGFTAAAGDHDVTWTIPNNWIDCTVINRNLYWVRARVSAYTSVTTQPKGTIAYYNTKTYDLHSKNTVNDATLIIYVNDVVTAKTFVSGGGGGSSDRITFAGYQTAGVLVVSSFVGYLRMKMVMGDKFSGRWFSPKYDKLEIITLREIQW